MPREPRSCSHCCADLERRPKETLKHFRERGFCNTACKKAEQEEKKASAGLRAWFKADLERRTARVKVPPKSTVSRPGFGRSPIVINDQRGAPENAPEEPMPVDEVDEL